MEVLRGFPGGLRGFSWGFLKELECLAANLHKISNFGHKSIKILGMVQVFYGFMG